MHLFRACYSKRVCHHLLNLIGTQRQAEAWESFRVKKKKGDDHVCSDWDSRFGRLGQANQKQGTQCDAYGKNRWFYLIGSREKLGALALIDHIPTIPGWLLQRLVWLPGLVALEIVGQGSIVIYGLATVLLYIQSVKNFKIWCLKYWKCCSIIWKPNSSLSMLTLILNLVILFYPSCDICNLNRYERIVVSYKNTPYTQDKYSLK